MTNAHGAFTGDGLRWENCDGKVDELCPRGCVSEFLCFFFYRKNIKILLIMQDARILMSFSIDTLPILFQLSYTARRRYAQMRNIVFDYCQTCKRLSSICRKNVGHSRFHCIIMVFLNTSIIISIFVLFKKNHKKP